MITTRLALLMTASAIALGGCGGSSNQKATGTAAAVAAAAQTTTTAATTTTARSATRVTTTAGSAAKRTTTAESATKSTTTPATIVAGTATKSTRAARTTKTASAPTATRHKKPPIRNVIIREAAQYNQAQQGAVPPVSGAQPAQGFIADCLSNNGLGQPLLLRPNEWRGTVALKQVPVYIEGPYQSTSQAQIAANALVGIESEAAGGLYMVSTFSSFHVDSYVNAVADCLAKAGDAPSGQTPLPPLPTN